MNSKLEKLIRLLLEQTEAGRVAWTWVSDDVFRTSVAHSIVRLSRASKTQELRSYLNFPPSQAIMGPERVDWQEVPGIRLVVTNPDGKVVEDEHVVDGQFGYSYAESLFKAARRAATDGDRVLDEILNSFPQPALK